MRRSRRVTKLSTRSLAVILIRSSSSTAIARTPRSRIPTALRRVAAMRSSRPGGGLRPTIRDGKAVEFQNFAKFETADLGYMLEIERFQAKVAGGEEVVPVALRVTSIFRLEDGAWKLLHRHADPITATRPPESVIQD